MNIFILTTGRSGSVSFVAACRHITNYTSAHESRSQLIGSEHFNYPDNHIEADNRLAWFLGAMDEKFGNDACYVHLVRSRVATASSFMKRYDEGIIKAYREAVLLGASTDLDQRKICEDYWDTVNSNIVHFLKNKENKITMHLESIENDFPVFWEKVRAEGDLSAAMEEWHSPRNMSPARLSNYGSWVNKCKRVVKGFPEYLKRT